jgi:uncharacterized membrane protein YdjX (TVP38/TMEM64 family)
MQSRPAVRLRAVLGGGERQVWFRGRFLAVTCVTVLAVVLLPYALLGPSFEDAAAAIFANQTSRLAVAGLGALLLAADMVLPIPSSLVATGLGAALGWFAGMLVSAVGLTIGCVLGFALGRSAGRRFSSGPLAADEDFVRNIVARYGIIAVVLCRGVPVLAEASVIAAGALGMPAWACFAGTTLANVGIASVYAGIGAAASDLSPAFSFLAALLLPGLLLGLASAAQRMWARRTHNAAKASGN